MADEVKQEEKKESNKMMGTMLKVVLGLVFLGLGVWAVIGWFPALATVFKGSVGLFLILAGIITLAIAKE
ncbi:MAG: hypothetical protein PHE58_06220 [Candidatus Omnitrophica bacterium]|nr:hypothetical protein [Candidatus Omnitrophota bacterium]